MPPEKNLNNILITISTIGGIIALIGIVVGLYFQILPERNPAIRYIEIGFFSLCIPILTSEAWRHLNAIEISVRHLEVFLVAMLIGLAALLFVAHQNGGILTGEFLAVVVLISTVIVLVVFGAQPIRRAFDSLLPINRISRAPAR